MNKNNATNAMINAIMTRHGSTRQCYTYSSLLAMTSQ
jgi:hypothetical protein